MDVTYYVTLPFVLADDGVAAGEAVECLGANAAVLLSIATPDGDGCSQRPLASRLPSSKASDHRIEEAQRGLGTLGGFLNDELDNLRRRDVTPTACRIPGGNVVRFEARPRSIYMMSGPSREIWEHSIPNVEAQRYSISFRTMAAKS